VPAGDDVAAPEDTGGGEACDDGDPCTRGDHLVDGTCTGTAYACDDGKACTDDACDGVGGCVWTLQAGQCLVDGVCAADGTAPAGETCIVCDVDGATDGWTEVSGACDDGDDCSENDRCQGGVCQGDALTCDDEEPCTTDTCAREGGCQFTPNALPCEDDDACTVGDVCHEGACQAGQTALVCDDGNPCTADGCDPASGCVAPNEPNGTACEDGNACTLGDRCVAGACTGVLVDACDDANECTIDTCDPASGCQHALDTANPCCGSGQNPCDDENPCTVDVCDPVGGDCTNTPQDGEPCEDGDVCTTGETCAVDECVAGGALDCDDDNPCTTDRCDPVSGCQNDFLAPGSTCDDGDDCTAGDVCTAGVCGGERLGCVDCPPAFWNPMDVVTALAIGTDGQPGSGLDVDQDPTTCAPATDCSGGVDNQFAQALSVLGSFVDVNETLAEAIADGDVNILFEHRDPTFDGAPYVLGAYIGEREASTCDPTVATCEYRVDAASLLADPLCEALIRFEDARIAAGRLTAGGPGARFSISLPFLQGVLLELTLYNARLEGDAVVTDGSVTGIENGLLGGAVRQQDVRDLVMALPDSIFEDVPGGRNLVLTLLPSIFAMDVDTNADGTDDATSIGLRFTARAATVMGVAP